MPGRRKKRSKPTRDGMIQHLVNSHKDGVATALLLNGNLSTALQKLYNDINEWNTKHRSDIIEHTDVIFQQSGNCLRPLNVLLGLNHSPDLAKNWALLKNHLPETVRHFDEEWTLLDWASYNHAFEFTNVDNEVQCEEAGPLLNLMAFLIFKLGHQPNINFNSVLTINHDKETITTLTYCGDSDDGVIENAPEIVTSYKPTLFENRPTNQTQTMQTEQKAGDTDTNPDINTAFANMTLS